MIPDEAVEAAIEALRTPPPNCPLQGVLSWRDIALTVLEAAAPHLMAGAWDEGHESGLVSAVSIDSAPNANPYKKDGAK